MDAKIVSLSENVRLKSPKYLYNLIPSVNRFYVPRNNTNVPSFNCRTEYFKNSFFPNVITEWNKLDINIKIKALK